MATYILLLTLTPDGRTRMMEDPEALTRAQAQCVSGEIQPLGLYGVLGEWDFVSIVEAPDNEAAAEFSLELGVRAGAHITTLPAVPIARFEGRERSRGRGAETGLVFDAPGTRGAPEDERPA